MRDSVIAHDFGCEGGILTLYRIQVGIFDHEIFTPLKNKTKIARGPLSPKGMLNISRSAQYFASLLPKIQIRQHSPALVPNLRESHTPTLWSDTRFLLCMYACRYRSRKGRNTVEKRNAASSRRQLPEEQVSFVHNRWSSEQQSAHKQRKIFVSSARDHELSATHRHVER